MIFATVGTQLPFDRLLHAVDTWAGAHAEVKVIAQIGETEQVFAHMTCRESIAQDEFREMFEQAEVIVGHAGMGTILTASELGKPVKKVYRKIRRIMSPLRYERNWGRYFVDHEKKWLMLVPYKCGVCAARWSM